MSIPHTPSRPVGHFCPDCGAEHSPDARFCEECGHRLDVPAPAPATGPSAPPPRSGLSPSALFGAAALVLAAAAVTFVLLQSGDDPASPPPTAAEPDYAAQVATLLAPLNEANAALTQDLLSLDRGDDEADALTSVRAAEGAAASARVAFGALPTPDGAEPQRLAISRAIARQRAFLDAAANALRRPTRAAAATVAARAEVARAAWRDTGIEGAGGRIAGVDRLTTWTRDQVTRAERRRRDAAAAKAKAEAEAKAKADAAAKAKADAARQRAFTPCGGFEGIIDSSASGVDCQTALRAVAWQITGNGSSEGFTCTITGTGELGAKVYSCSRADGARIRFSAFVG